MKTSENYVEAVLRTDTPITQELIDRHSNPSTIRLIHAVLGMVTESAELADMLKRHLFYGKPIDVVNGMEELGDNQWYVGLAIDVFKTTMNDILTMNINKLQLRYPEKFCETKAVERNLDAERELLENLKKPAPEIVFTDNDFTTCSYDGLGISERGADWLDFSDKVFRHIENYTVPQYGDKGEDQVTNYSDKECVRQVEKYAARFGKNAREGQQELDFIKIAHYAQLADSKYESEV